MLLTLASIGLAIQMKRATQASMIKKFGILSGIISVVAAFTSLAADIIYASDSWAPEIITPTSPNPRTSRQLLSLHIIYHVPSTPGDHKIPHLDYSFVLHLMGCIVLLLLAAPTILFSTMYASGAAQLKDAMANKMATTLTNHIRVMAVVNALNNRYTSLQQQQQQQRQLQQRQALYDGQFGGQGLGTSSVDFGEVTTEFAGGDVEI
ncbi:unnamed protein product [Lymnaea stagnalis]|uniref:Uncharacterized protein n=1 Tax=Lymnaea stagnalis TaxID=6523 RepID=A0AAV2H0F3_LYMST